MNNYVFDGGSLIDVDRDMNTYVFDSAPLIDIFRHYYRQQFPSFWSKFDDMVDKNRIISTREVYIELEGRGDELANWCKRNKKLFSVPTNAEIEVVKQIFNVQHFQMNVPKKNRRRNFPVADPFVIALAKVMNCSVVTAEKESPHAAKIPNICRHFDVDCTDVKGFMEREKLIL